MTYASESMRLTTRLLELASWLVIRRALRTGEISREEATAKRRRLKLTTIGRPEHVADFDKLPLRLRDLIDQSFALHDRIMLLDKALDQPNAATVTVHANPVGDQVDRLSAAFGDARLRTG